MTEISQPLIDTSQYEQGLAWHNVGGVLRGADTSVSSAVEKHYGTRAGHIPQMENVGVMVYDPSDPEIVDQMAYQSRLIGKNIRLLDSSSPVQESTLAVPYINTPQAEERLRKLGMDVWGLPSVMVHSLKNKASCHDLISQAGIDGFSTPDYEVCPVEELPEVGNKVLKETETIYAKTGLLGKYPLGLMVRTAESDGNYGAAVIRQEGNKIVVLPDGNKEKIVPCSDWTSALSTATTMLSGTLDLRVENRIVISRFMDLADSPGESLVISNGETISLGWNGQVHEPGSSACVGTSSYQASTPELRNAQNEYEHTTAAPFTRFLKYVATHLDIDFPQINGVVNVDWMIPGPLENEFQRRLGRRSQITVAEINPRFTNWTDAVLLAMWVTGKEQTVQNMLTTIAEGILAVDKLPIPLNSQVSMQQVRDGFTQLDERLKNSDGSRVILRMPDRPKMGVMFYGNTANAKAQTEHLIASLQ